MEGRRHTKRDKSFPSSLEGSFEFSGVKAYCFCFLWWVIHLRYITFIDDWTISLFYILLIDSLVFLFPFLFLQKNLDLGIERVDYANWKNLLNYWVIVKTSALSLFFFEMDVNLAQRMQFSSKWIESDKFYRKYPTCSLSLTSKLKAKQKLPVLVSAHFQSKRNKNGHKSVSLKAFCSYKHSGGYINNFKIFICLFLKLFLIVVFVLELGMWFCTVNWDVSCRFLFWESHVYNELGFSSSMFRV